MSAEGSETRSVEPTPAGFWNSVLWSRWPLGSFRFCSVLFGPAPLARLHWSQSALELGHVSTCRTALRED